MRIKTLTFQEFSCNTYVIGEENEPAIIIDPGYSKPGYFDEYINKHHNGICQGVILTHNHFDHISGLVNNEIFKSCPLYVHVDDISGLDDPYLNLSALDSKNVKVTLTASAVEDNDFIKLGNYSFKVIHTPFHTYGSICLYCEDQNILFSGDTLFNRGIGRTDFKTSCPRFIKQSLLKLTKLRGNTIVYPGHGRPTTIETELKYGYLSTQL